MTHEEAVAKLAKMIKGIQIAMLTTIDSKGRLQSRPMATQQVEFDGDLWFFTGWDTHKTSEISDNNQVNVSYSSPDDNRYVSVSGNAALVSDKAKMAELWNPLLKAWFPEGIEDPNMVLLKVEVHKAEYWDSPSSKVVQIVGFVKALATGERYQPGDNKVLSL